MIVVEGFVGKQIFSNGDFKIYSCYVLDEYKDKVSINKKYGSISISGTLPTLLEKTKYKFELEEIVGGKYPNSYEVLRMYNNNPKDENYKDRFLQTMVTEKQYITIKSAYPDFIDLVINNQPIDTSQLHGIGEIILDKIKTKINENFVLVDLIGKYSDLGMTMKGLKNLYDTYKSVELIDEKINKDPYGTLTRLARVGFKKADVCLIKKFPYLKDSITRGKSCVDYILKENESNGNTWISYTNLYRQLKELAPETSKHFQEIITTREDYYYHEPTKRVSLIGTYMCEREVCNKLLEMNDITNIWDLDSTKFNQVDGFPLSVEQMQIQKNLCLNNLNLLVGVAGCVDKDTEFFNGTKWKPISEYTKEDLVLQFNKEDGSGTLVYPQRFIKEPCDFMWHFKTKYGLDQCLSDEHTIVYETSKGNINKKSFLDFKNMHENGTGFRGKFLTTFNYSGKGIELSNEEIRVMCAVICDGSFYVSGGSCAINIKKQRKKDRLEKILRKANIDYKIWKSAKNYSRYIFKAPKKEKEFLDYWYNCTQEQLQVICDEILNWDGSTIGKRMSFSNTSEKTIDFVQFAFTSCGFKTVKKIDDRVGESQKSSNGKEYIRKSICYNLSITKRNKIGLNTDAKCKGKKTKINQYKTLDGYKYCFTVPSGMLILRRNGKIFITGNCGKTFSTKALIDMLKANSKKFILMSATGKASKVLEENTKQKAYTIHRGLKYSPKKGFLYNSENKLPYDVVIIDEYSMIDIFLFRSLLRAIGENTKLILIGDPFQIPSVGCGNCAYDLLHSQIIPTSLLTKVFRYESGGLSYVATEIREGRYYLKSKDKVQVYGEDKDYVFINANKEDMISVIKKLYSKLLKKNTSIDDIVLLTAYNKGEFGTFALNKVIQDLVNPKTATSKEFSITRDKIEIVFRENDRVMQIVNNYKVTNTEGELCQIMNGDMGTIVKIEGENIFIDFDGCIVKYEKGDLSKLLLGYCISLHKSQGSSIKNVILVTPDEHMFFLNRNLMYVGVTRARKLVYHIGTIKTIKNALRKSENLKRDTFAEEMLVGDL